MRLVTIGLADFAAIDGELSVAEWIAFYQAHGIDSTKVIRSYPTQDQTGTVFECED